MAQIVKRAYKYRFYPTPEQAGELARTFGCVRFVYNKALEERTRAYVQEGYRVSYVESSAALTAWKRSGEFDFLSEVSSVPLQQALRHLQAGFSNFFAKRAKYPAFKSKRKSRASAEYTRSAFRWRDGRLTLAKMDAPLGIVWARPLPEGAEPSTVTVSRDAAGRWFVSLLVEQKISPLAPAERTVGVDAGITALVTLSTGEKIVNPRHERRDRRKLATAQRALARKQKGSNNRAKAKLRVAKVYARVADRRRDFLHKLTTRLVSENQTVVIEDLTVRNMVKNHTLARAISEPTSPRRRRGSRPVTSPAAWPASTPRPTTSTPAPTSGSATRSGATTAATRATRPRPGRSPSTWQARRCHCPTATASPSNGSGRRARNWAPAR